MQAGGFKKSLIPKNILVWRKWKGFLLAEPILFL